MARRTLLFLQGPASPVMARVADAVEARGHAARRINLCLGDAVFWRRPGADGYRGRLADWPAHVEAYVDRHGVTDLVAFADGRPYQAAAITVAQRKGVRVHAVEHGYLRPDWVTVEPDGMSSFSRFPRDPASVRALAEGAPPVDVAPLARESFLRYCLYDLAYNLPNVGLGWATHPHYRHHGAVHPLVEYGAWAVKLAARGRARRRAERVIAAALAAPRGPLFLVPLQLAGDYQIRVHSPFARLDEAVDLVLRAFAAEAPADARLLFKAHPLDNGLARWPARVATLARAAGVEDRVFVADGGDLDRLIDAAAGVITVNSTVGLAALRSGRPLTALGNAVYDIEGLTDRRPLGAFLSDPRPPDPDLVDAFLRALAATAQVRGGFVAPAAVAAAAAAIAERILEPEPRLAGPAVPRDAALPAFRLAAERTAAGAAA